MVPRPLKVMGDPAVTSALSLTSSTSPIQSPGDRAAANILMLALYSRVYYTDTGPGGLGLGAGVLGDRRLITP